MEVIENILYQLIGQIGTNQDLISRKKFLLRVYKIYIYIDWEYSSNRLGPLVHLNLFIFFVKIIKKNASFLSYYDGMHKFICKIENAARRTY